VRRGLHQQPILEAARQALDISFEGDTTTLAWVRKQVAANIKSFMHQQVAQTATVINQYHGNVMNTNIRLGSVEVSGTFNLVTAAHLKNSFNKTAFIRENDDLRAKLRELTIAVARLAERLPRADAENVTADLATLISEATSPHPHPERYAPAAKGIVAVAKSIADMASSIANAVSDVMAILGA
jgi:hypothetical protein